MYRTAIDAVNFLVDFITKENFYSKNLHSELFKFSDSLTDKVRSIVLEHVTPKIDA